MWKKKFWEELTTLTSLQVFQCVLRGKQELQINNLAPTLVNDTFLCIICSSQHSDIVISSRFRAILKYHPVFMLMIVAYILYLLYNIQALYKNCYLRRRDTSQSPR